MTSTLRIVLLIVVLAYFVIVVSLLKKKKLELKYTLLWLFMGFCFLLLTIFPVILEWISNLLGFADMMNALYVCIIGFILIILLALTSIVSKQSERIKNLTQYSALLERRIRQLEEDIEVNQVKEDK